MPRCPVPVFVLGCGRSGTTVTARLLNHLPGVHIAKETGYLNQHLDLLKQIREAIVPAALLQVVNSWMQTNDWTGRASAEGFADFCRRHLAQQANQLRRARDKIRLGVCFDAEGRFVIQRFCRR